MFCGGIIIIIIIIIIIMAIELTQEIDNRITTITEDTNAYP